MVKSGRCCSRAQCDSRRTVSLKHRRGGNDRARYAARCHAKCGFWPDRFDRALNSKSFQPTSAMLAMFTKCPICQNVKRFPLSSFGIKWRQQGSGSKQIQSGLWIYTFMTVKQMNVMSIIMILICLNVFTLLSCELDICNYYEVLFPLPAALLLTFSSLMPFSTFELRVERHCRKRGNPHIASCNATLTRRITSTPFQNNTCRRTDRNMLNEHLTHSVI